jgi:hypothetical protein
MAAPAASRRPGSCTATGSRRPRPPPLRPQRQGHPARRPRRATRAPRPR